MATQSSTEVGIRSAPPVAVATLSLVLMAMVSCTSKPVRVGVVFENDWEVGKETLTAREHSGCYDSHTSDTYEHFFGTKHWSSDALAIMRGVLPSGGNVQ